MSRNDFCLKAGFHLHIKGLVLDLEDFSKTYSWKLHNLPSVQNSNQENPEQDFVGKAKKRKAESIVNVFTSVCDESDG